MKNINLLPDEIKKNQNFKKLVVISIFYVIAVLFIYFLSSYIVNSYSSHLKKTTENSTLEDSKYIESEKIATDLKKTTNLINNSNNIINALKNPLTIKSQIFSDLLMLSNEDLKITGVDCNGTSNTIVVEGETANLSSLSQFMENIILTKKYDNPTFTKLNKNNDIAIFEITINYLD